MWTYPSLLLWPSYNLTCDISNMKLLPYILFTQTRTGFYPEEVRMHQTAKYGIMHTSHQRKENHVFKMESWFTGFLKEHTHTHTHTQLIPLRHIYKTSISVTEFALQLFVCHVLLSLCIYSLYRTMSAIVSIYTSGVHPSMMISDYIHFTSIAY